MIIISSRPRGSTVSRTTAADVRHLKTITIPPVGIDPRFPSSISWCVLRATMNPDVSLKNFKHS